MFTNEDDQNQVAENQAGRLRAVLEYSRAACQRFEQNRRAQDLQQRIQALEHQQVNNIQNETTRRTQISVLEERVNALELLFSLHAKQGCSPQPTTAGDFKNTECDNTNEGRQTSSAARKRLRLPSFL